MTFKSLFTIAIASVMALGVAVLPARAQAQQQVPNLSMSSIGIINIDEVRANSEAFKKARAQIVKFNDDASARLEQENTALSQANEELGRKRTLLAPDAFASERQAFEQRVQAFQRDVQQHQKTLNQVQGELVQTINRKITQIVVDYAAQEGLLLVLPEQAVIVSAGPMAIDDIVLERLNKELPSVPVSFPGE